MQAHDALARTLAGMAGPGAEPRDDQVVAVDALMAGRRVLLVQATGWGKSAVYWAATLGLREAGRGPTVVISPLLALMRDQVSAAEKAGLRAATADLVLAVVDRADRPVERLHLILARLDDEPKDVEVLGQCAQLIEADRLA